MSTTILFSILLLGVLLHSHIGQAQERAIRPPTNVANFIGGNSGKVINFKKYRYDSDSNKYIRLGTTEQCPDNMRFFAVHGNATAGQCDCDYYQCSRPSIYDPAMKKCHFAWTQGPCDNGKWYAFDAQLKPICEDRTPCPLETKIITAETVSLTFWFKDPKDGKCYENGSTGHCENEDETLLIAPGEPIPECRSTTFCVPLGRPEPQLCFPGNRRTHLGLCN